MRRPAASEEPERFALLRTRPSHAAGAGSPRFGLWARLLAFLASVVAHLRGRAAEAAQAGSLQVDDEGLLRTSGEGALRVVTWGTDFGITLIGARQPGRGLLVFTSQARRSVVFVQGTHAQGCAMVSTLFAGAPVGPEVDAHFHASGSPPCLDGAGARDLLAALRTRAPHAIGRLITTCTRQRRVELTAHDLRLGDRTFDLSAPLEWRHFRFVEPGPAAFPFAATWLRQGAVEAVLVAPQADFPGDPGARRPLEAPPASDLRVAIEPLFLAPLRRALERARTPRRLPAAIDKGEGGRASRPAL